MDTTALNQETVARRQRHRFSSRGRFVPQARSAHHGQKSGDVRRGSRRGFNHDPTHMECASSCWANSVLDCKSHFGSGSPLLFANFAEAMAEGRGKAQAETCAKRAPKPKLIACAMMEVH